MSCEILAAPVGYVALLAGAEEPEARSRELIAAQPSASRSAGEREGAPFESAFRRCREAVNSLDSVSDHDPK